MKKYIEPQIKVVQTEPVMLTTGSDIGSGQF